MSILVDKNTRLICQGITGKAGAFHSEQCKAYGTNLVGGITPGRGGTTTLGVPIFDTCSEAVAATGANATMIFVPPPFAADAIMEAADAGIKVIVAITEGIPVLDMARAVAYLEGTLPGVRLIGPNCPGIITPGACKIGIMPGYIHKRGPHRRRQPLGDADVRGRVAAHEPGHRPEHLHRHRRRPGQRHQLRRRARRSFEADPETDGVLMMGEIGGNAEEQAAALKASGKFTKPLAAFIAGQTAPPGKRMGHAGAIISGGSGKASDKIAALEAAGIRVAKSPADMGATLQAALKG